jgi:methionyl-tRNA formyltransferase
MQLADIAMVAADTSRSRAYLQALVRNELLPNYVLVLANISEQTLPGQLKVSRDDLVDTQIVEPDECWSEAHFDPTEPILDSLETASIAYEVSTNNDINDSSVVERISQRREPVFIYSGFGGVLLKDNILNTGKLFLHVHGGYLPDYKGSTTNYYSLIVENTLGASSLFLEKEIDSGPVLFRQKFSPPKDVLSIDHVYDSAARAKVLVETLRDYARNKKWKFEIEKNTGGEIYYIIHPVLKHIAILRNQQSNCLNPVIRDEKD